MFSAFAHTPCGIYIVRYVLEIEEMHILLVENMILILLCVANRRPAVQNVGTMM